MAPKSDREAGKTTPPAKDPIWQMRILDGMCLSGFLRLLARNRLDIAPRRIAMAMIVGTVSCFNSVLWAVQQLVYGRRIERTEIQHHPIFIIGHWRSGTTLLHELLVLDERHTYPNSYACFAPNHFVATSWLFKRCLWFLLPSSRPIDNMPLGFDRPQEDEFALCNMGIPSPYLTLAFPNRAPQSPEYLDLRGLSVGELDRWRRALAWFLKCVTLQNPGKRIVLKSPPHTARIKVLLELFPDARFVHIVRDPYVLFPSTVHLWRRLSSREGLQTPRHEGLEAHVLETFNRLYEAFNNDRDLVAPNRYAEVRYEDLVKNPMAEMKAIYDRLELGDFDKARPAIERYFAGAKDYKTNRYTVSAETRSEVQRHWGWFIEKYGYGPA